MFIMYSWLQLMVEHMVILSQEAGSDEYSDGVSAEVQKIIQGHPCHINDVEDIKVYHSSEKHTIRVNLTIDEDKTTFGEVAKIIDALEERLSGLADVEKVKIMTKSVGQVQSDLHA